MARKSATQTSAGACTDTALQRSTTSIGVAEEYDHDLKRWMTHYEQVRSVVDEDALIEKVRWLQGKVYVDRLVAVIEAHVMAAAKAREACSIMPSIYSLSPCV
mgnify:CR=1 FL=1